MTTLQMKLPDDATKNAETAKVGKNAEILGDVNDRSCRVATKDSQDVQCNPHVGILKHTS